MAPRPNRNHNKHLIQNFTELRSKYFDQTGKLYNDNIDLYTQWLEIYILNNQ